MSDILQVLSSMPRSARWLAVAAAGVAGYFLVVEPMMDATMALNARCAAAERELTRHEQGAPSRSAERQTVRRGLQWHGEVLLPADAADRSVKFDEAVATVLDRHGVKNHLSTTRVSPAPSGPIEGSVPANRRVERLIRDVQLDCTPEQLSAILAALEQSPEVAAVSRVQARRAGDAARQSDRALPPRSLRVTLTIETLLASPKDRSRA
ncbi:MAG: hypothetical protein JNM07_05280 [Phycisphaerae bacterium]|nr:hypothetical protein [Phycisphaerae bacterium]